eukprot:scaffold658832_cov57-Prasinocladus_malaysianus.AAC.1
MEVVCGVDHSPPWLWGPQLWLTSGVFVLAGRELSAKAAPERYFWSVTPSLVVFPVVILPPLASSLVITGTLLAIGTLLPKDFFQSGVHPFFITDRYMTLRLPLTIGATSGMLMTAYHFTYLAPA